MDILKVIAAIAFVVFVGWIVNEQKEACEARGGKFVHVIKATSKCEVGNDKPKRTQEQQLRSEDVPQR